MKQRLKTIKDGQEYYKLTLRPLIFRGGQFNGIGGKYD